MSRVEVISRGVYKKVNPCLDHEGRRRVKIGEVYQVQLLVCEGMVSDGMWVSLTHAARFADKAAAEKLADRVRVAVREASKAQDEGRPVEGWGGVNLAHWTWSPSPTNAFSDLQKAPTAKEYDVPA